MHDPIQWNGFLKSTGLSATGITRQALLVTYIKYMDRAILAAGKPFVQSTKPLVHDKDMDELESVGDPIYRVKFDADRADNDLLVAELGLQAYRVNYGEYPDHLNRISPIFLKALPSDPFANGAPVRYIKTGSSYILYSVGPDGSDDNGAPIDDPSLSTHDVTGRLRHIVTATSKGDIVAGVNTF